MRFKLIVTSGIVIAASNTLAVNLPEIGSKLTAEEQALLDKVVLQKMKKTNEKKEMTPEQEWQEFLKLHGKKIIKKAK